MKLRPVLGLSVLGVVFGAPPVLGVDENRMWFAWIALRLLGALWIARASAHGHFRSGFAAGFLGAAGAVGTAVLFYGTYTGNHPEFLERTPEMPLGVHPRLFLVGMGIAGGIVHGIAQGALAWIAGKVVSSRIG